MSFLIIYIFLLFFCRIGISILEYTFSIGDIFFIITFPLSILLTKLVNIKKIFIPFLLFYFIFISYLSITYIVNLNYIQAKIFLLEFIPFIYAFFLYIYIYSNLHNFNLFYKFFKNYLFLYPLYLIGIIFIIFFFWENIPIWENKRLIFFLKKPNQLASLIINLGSIYFIFFYIKKYIYNNIKRNEYFLILIMIFISIYILILTGSRAGIFSFIIILCINIMFIFRKYFLFILLLILSFTIGWIYSPLFKIDIYIISRYQEFIFYNLINLKIEGVTEETIYKGFEIFTNNPFLGAGLGVLRIYYTHEVHNLIIKLLSNIGIIGFVLFLLWILYIPYLLLKCKVDKLLSILILMNLIVIMLILQFTHYMLRERWIHLFISTIVLTIINIKNKAKCVV